MSRRHIFTAADDAKILRLRSEGLTWDAIGERFGLPLMTVYGRAKRIATGVAPRTEPDCGTIGQCDCGSWVCRTLHERGPFRCSMCRGARMLQIVAERRRIAA